MLHFLARRVPSVAAMLLVASVVAFLLPRLGSGDPAQTVAGADATLEQVEAVRVQLGLDRPLAMQYVTWLAGVATGDLGVSLINGRPIAEMIFSRMGSTFQLAVAAALLMIVIGLGLGVLAGSSRRGPLRTMLDGLLSALLAMPPHVTGLILILVLGIAWPLLPISGEVSMLRNPLQGLTFLLLPAFALALPQAAQAARLIQSRMYQVQQEEFIDLAIAKGVPPHRIAISHVLRNSLGTAVIAIGIRFGELLAGAVVVEAIFARNGLGTMAVTAVLSRDYAVVQILVLGAVVVAVLVHLLCEIVLAMLDPRIRLEAA